MYVRMGIQVYATRLPGAGFSLGGGQDVPVNPGVDVAFRGTAASSLAVDAAVTPYRVGL
jgi:hypothetical protein